MVLGSASAKVLVLNTALTYLPHGAEKCGEDAEGRRVNLQAATDNNGPCCQKLSWVLQTVTGA